MDSANPPAGNPDLGGLKIPPIGDTPASSNPTDPNASAAANIIQKRRGRPPGSTNKSSDGGNKQSIPSLSPEQFKALYSPELWSRIALAPADAMAFSTQKKYWEASEGEKKAVGETCSIAAACFATTDPRWLAVAAAAVTLANFYGLRIAQMAADKRKEAEEKKKTA